VNISNGSKAPAVSPDEGKCVITLSSNPVTNGRGTGSRAAPANYTPLGYMAKRCVSNLLSGRGPYFPYPRNPSLRRHEKGTPTFGYAGLSSVTSRRMAVIERGPTQSPPVGDRDPSSESGRALGEHGCRPHSPDPIQQVWYPFGGPARHPPTSLARLPDAS